MTNQASLPLTTDYFNEWTKRRALASLSSNVGSPHIPFQNWRRFKEAFTPELVARAVLQHPAKVERILDPFSGSGTTALACQFLGITPIAIEVNPYLADLTEAKLATYNAAQVARAVGEVTSTAHVTLEELTTFYQGLPSTFIEPGEKGRWIFSRQTAGEILQLVAGIERITDADIRRLLRVLLGAVLIDVSNITVSGKGRRYRRGWEQRDVTGEASFKLVRAVGQAVHDITRYSDKKLTLYNVLRGDARTLIHDAPRIDLAIYSPPYPNSFDYTDVYNVELWMLRYFKSGVDNHRLRQATLSSHVQLLRPYAEPPKSSPTLNRILEALDSRRDQLWSKHIPAMIGAYFSEMIALISAIATRLSPGGRQWIVVGDSRYAGVDIGVASVLCELSKGLGLEIIDVEPFRSMRAAPQQGGRPELPETLLVIGN